MSTLLLNFSDFQSFLPKKGKESFLVIFSKGKFETQKGPNDMPISIISIGISLKHDNSIFVALTPAAAYRHISVVTSWPQWVSLVPKMTPLRLDLGGRGKEDNHPEGRGKEDNQPEWCIIQGKGLEGEFQKDLEDMKGLEGELQKDLDGLE